jgi:hypothetical protein
MSAAAPLARTAAIPAPALPDPAAETARLASVTVLLPPGRPEEVAPVRLTRRGVVVLTLAVLAVGAGLVLLAKLSAPEPGVAPPAPHVVTVQPGDTLWSIANRVAPGRDPRAEVAALERRNHLSSVDLLPGQRLRVP